MFKQKLSNMNNCLSTILITDEHLDRMISNFKIEFVTKSIKNKKHVVLHDGITGELNKYGTWKWNEYDAEQNCFSLYGIVSAFPNIEGGGGGCDS